jgi:fibronectin type 3 domain-containing protein
MSVPVTAVAADVFPPASPTGLIAVAGVSTVELAWDRNPEPDLGSYRVYRRAGNEQFTVLADAVEGVAYTDRQVQAGITYSYQITALDKSGNESRPSADASAVVP